MSDILEKMQIDDSQLDEVSGGKSSGPKKYRYECQACGKSFELTKAEMKIVNEKCHDTLCKKCGKWKKKWFE